MIVKVKIIYQTYTKCSPYGANWRYKMSFHVCTLLTGVIFFLCSLAIGGEIRNNEAFFRLAVLYFENNSSAHKVELSPLAKGLCDMMITDMKCNEKLQVIERTRIEEVMKELRLTRDNHFDKKTTQELGKLLAVQYLVLGSYFDLFEKFRIDARIVKVETGEIFVAAGMTGKQEEFDIIEQMLVKQLLLQLFPPIKSDIEEKQTERQKANIPSPQKATINLRGAVVYGSALDKADSGNKLGAVALLRDVVESNPDFALAKQMLADFTK